MNPTPSTGWPAYANGKYVSFASTGAAVVDVGVNGGNDTTHYGYAAAGFTTGDGYLHAGGPSGGPKRQSDQALLDRPRRLLLRNPGHGRRDGLHDTKPGDAGDADSTT